MSDLTPSPDKSGEITSRVEAATALPWDIFRYRNGGGRIHIDEKAQPERHRDLIADMEPSPDGIVTVYNEGHRELLFHAPEDIRYLLGLRNAVLELHTPRHPDLGKPACNGCWGQVWPCATVQALGVTS